VVRHTFTTRGYQLVNVWMESADGGWGTGRAVWVGGVPEASITADRDEVVAGEPITFDASATDADTSSPAGTLQSYRWDVDGDGSYERQTVGPRITVRPRTAGPFTPRVEARNDLGLTDTATGPAYTVLPPAGPLPEPEPDPVPPPSHHPAPPPPPAKAPPPVKPPPRPDWLDAPPVQSLERAVERGIAVELSSPTAATAQISVQMAGDATPRARAAASKILARRSVRLRPGARVSVRIKLPRAAARRLRRAKRARVRVDARIGRRVVRQTIRLR
jgi:hypothetical protein